MISNLKPILFLLLSQSKTLAQNLFDLETQPNMVTNDNSLLVQPDEPDGDFDEIFGNPTQYEDYQGGQMIINLFQGANECVANLIQENGIQQDTQHLFDKVFSDQWITTVEFGSKSQFQQELGEAIDPLVQKVMGISGDQFVDSMSYELGQWIKDTTLLWVKNRGAGQTTTEFEINQLRQEDRHERNMKNQAQFYEQKLDKQRDDFQKELELLRKDHERNLVNQAQEFQTKAKTLSQLYLERMKNSIDKTSAAYEAQLTNDIQKVQSQCADQLREQIEVYKRQMETCSQSVDRHGEINQSLVEDKAECDARLIQLNDKLSFELIAKEQKIIDDMTLQCEQEKETFIETFESTMMLTHTTTIKELQTKVIQLQNESCQTDLPQQTSTNSTSSADGVKIMIEMKKDGNYTIKEWTNSNNATFDGMIFEIFKNEKGHLQLVHWTEDELMQIFNEMKAYWDNEEFWDQVMIGYTDLNETEVWNHYQNLDIHQDACHVLAYHLSDQDEQDQVDWQCQDVWAGNADDLNLKRFRKNQYEKHQAIKKGIEQIPQGALNDTLEMANFTRGNGKCRNNDGHFDHDHSYFPTGPDDTRPEGPNKHRVRDIQGCKKVCANDSRCSAFHFFLLDPGAFNNCWIWTEPGYLPNGSDKAYCYVKDDYDHFTPEESDMIDVVVDSIWDAFWGQKDNNTKPKPENSLNDWDNYFIQNNSEMFADQQLTDLLNYTDEISDTIDTDLTNAEQWLQQRQIEQSQELSNFGECHEYLGSQTCVEGENLAQFKNMTREDCQYICSHTQGCLGVEYFKQSTAWNRENVYEEGDCNLSSGLDTSTCDPNVWQMYLWVKGDQIPCNQHIDDYREHQHSMDVIEYQRAVVRSTDMSLNMQKDAIDISTDALEMYTRNRDIAKYIKNKFEQKYNSKWRCIVSKQSGLYDKIDINEAENYIHFNIDQVSIILYKLG